MARTTSIRRISAIQEEGTTRALIVNADDLGRSQGINRGIIKAHAHGIVTSASLMVRWPAAGEAAAWAREHRDVSIGLHLDLAEWRCQGHSSDLQYQIISLTDLDAVRDEVRRQFDLFHHLMGRGPTHIDSHHNVHLREPAGNLIVALAQSFLVPIRMLTPNVRFCGTFFGLSSDGLRLSDPIKVPALIQILVALQEGFTEMRCHPGIGVSREDSSYSAERDREVATLCHPAVRAVVADQDIRLCSFADVPTVF